VKITLTPRVRIFSTEENSLHVFQAFSWFGHSRNNSKGKTRGEAWQENLPLPYFFAHCFLRCTPTNWTKQTLKTWNSDSKGPLQKTFFLSLWNTQIWNVTMNQIDWWGISKRQTGHNIKINLVLCSEKRCWNKTMLLYFIKFSLSVLDLYNKTCITGHL